MDHRTTCDHRRLPAGVLPVERSVSAAVSDSVFCLQANPPPVVVNADGLDTPPYVSLHCWRAFV